MFKVSCYLEQQNHSGDDQLLVLEKNDAIWFCIADGAGGSGYGTKASQLIVSAFNNLADDGDDVSQPDDFERFIRELDQQVQFSAQGGESTAIVGKIKNHIVVGASVGDSEVWLYNQDHEYELTSLQQAKPLLGSGKCVPIGFGPVHVDCAMLMGSDGLFKYANAMDLHAAVRSGLSAEEISSLVRMPTGKLHDDISIIHIVKNI